MRRSTSVCWLALAACTIDNPHYEDTGGTEPPEDPTGDPEAPECELEPPRSRPLSVTLDEDARAPECPEGQNEIIRFTVDGGPVELVDGRLELLACEGDCDCPLVAPQRLAIELGDDVVLAESVSAFGCGRVELWTREGPEGCEWSGFVHYDNLILPVLPSVIVANELSVPPISLFQGYALTLGLVGEDECTEVEPCESGYFPGRHALDALGQAAVSVDDPPVPVDLVATFDGTVYTYLFDNRESSVTLECETWASWTAQRLQ